MSETGSKSPRLTAVPSARSSAPVLQIRIIAVLGTLLVAALLGLASTVAWTYSAMNPPPPVNLSDALPKAQGFASLVAQSYLSGTPTELPTMVDSVKDLPATGYLPHETPQWIGFEAAPAGNGLTFERHRFLFYRVYPGETQGDAPKRQLSELFIPLSVSADGSPALAAQPYFRPVPYTDKAGTLFPQTDEQLPSEVSDTLTAWSKAWASSNSEALKTIAGDGTVGVRYIGLGGGCSAQRITPLNVYKYGAEEWLVRARVQVRCANEYVTDMDMDVTVVGASPNPTRVVGWGPIGSGVLDLDSVRVKA